MAALGNRSPEQRDQRLGVIGTLVAVLLAVTSLSSDSVSPLLAGRTLSAVFAEAGGLEPDDEVVVSGMAVGRVEDVRLRDTDVLVTFTVDEPGLHLGKLSRASIKARSALGKKALNVSPAGDGELADGEMIPLRRTTAPYDITQALQGLTERSSALHTDRLAQAMNTVSDAFSGTSRHVPAALNGVRRLAETVNARDTELRELLRHARTASGVLADHDDDLNAMFTQGTTLLNALNQRQHVIEQLLGNITDVSAQLRGVVKDNDARLGPALDEARGVLSVLRENRDNIATALKNAVPLTRELGEVMASTPALDAYFANIPPTNMVPTLPQLLGRGGHR